MSEGGVLITPFIPLISRGIVSSPSTGGGEACPVPVIPDLIGDLGDHTWVRVINNGRQNN